jgi:hypothetical protein
MPKVAAIRRQSWFADRRNPAEKFVGTAAPAGIGGNDAATAPAYREQACPKVRGGLELDCPATTATTTPTAIAARQIDTTGRGARRPSLRARRRTRTLAFLNT